MLTIEVPNLDTEDADELEAFSEALRTLAGYARHKATAQRARRAGAIEAAQHSERQCERRYADLPRWARW